MKTIYSLKEFRNRLLEIAKLINEDYAEARVDIKNNGQVLFSGYIHTLGGWDTFTTMEDCLNSFRNKVTPLNIDVEIDVPINS